MANMKKYTDEEQSIIKKQKAAIARDQKTRFKDPQGVGLGESPTPRRANPFANIKTNELASKAIPMPDIGKKLKNKQGTQEGATGLKTPAKKPLFGEGDAKTRGGKANVSKKQLDAFGGTLTQYMNQWNKSGKRPTKVSAAGDGKTTDKKKTTNKKVEPKKKSFREKRLDRMGERLASAKSEGRKRRIKRRMERVKGRMADDEKKKSKGMMGGGMMKAKGRATGGMMKTKGAKAGGKFPDLTGDGKVTRKDILKGRGVPGMKGGGMKTKGSMAGGKMKTKGYSAGGVKKAKAKKLRGAGIERRGYRPVKMR